MGLIEEVGIRFLVGGVVVSAFALLGEMWNPKSFAGLFGAAPSVALVTITLAFLEHDPAYVARTATAMIGGAIAMFVYAFVCARVTKIRHIPVWLETGVAWLSWVATAGAIYAAMRIGFGA